MESPLRQTTKHNIFKRVKNAVTDKANEVLNNINQKNDLEEVEEKLVEKTTGVDPLTDKNKQSLKNYQSLYGKDFDPRNIMENFNIDSDTLLVSNPNFKINNQQLASLELTHPNKNFKGFTQYTPRGDNQMEAEKGFNVDRRGNIDFSNQGPLYGSDVIAEHWNKQKLMDRWRFNRQ